LESGNATTQQQLSEIMIFLSFSISPGSAETLVRLRGKIKYLLIACLLSNVSAKNYQNQFMHVRVIVRQSSDIFWDTLYCSSFSLSCDHVSARTAVNLFQS